MWGTQQSLILAAMNLPNGSSLIFSFVLLVQGLSALAQATSPKHDTAAGVPTNIHQLFLDDQSDRTGNRTVALYGADVNTRDAMRRSELRKLLAIGAIRSAQDFHDAAYILQHSQEADDYLLAHILAVEAIIKGDVSSKWISAATLDRYLQSMGKSQVFGTQYSDKKYLYMIQHKNDPNVMRNPAAQGKGMTQEPYNRVLVPDALRNDFCVPNLETQNINLKEFEAGRSPAGIIPPGCSR